MSSRISRYDPNRVSPTNTLNKVSTKVPASNKKIYEGMIVSLRNRTNDWYYVVRVYNEIIEIRGRWWQNDRYKEVPIEEFWNMYTTTLTTGSDNIKAKNLIYSGLVVTRRCHASTNYVVTEVTEKHITIREGTGSGQRMYPLDDFWNTFKVADIDPGESTKDVPKLDQEFSNQELIEIIRMLISTRGCNTSIIEELNTILKEVRELSDRLNLVLHSEYESNNSTRTTR